MKKKAFTLLEIIVVVVIIGILTTIGLPVYQNIVQSSKDRVDYINLETLLTWVDIKAMEQGSVPGSLSELRQEDLDKAYAQVMRSKDAWKNRIASFIVNGPQWGLAYAQGLGCPYLRSPNNPDTSPNAISYGINLFVAKMGLLDYRNLGDDVVIVANSPTATFSYKACPTIRGGFTGTDEYSAAINKMGGKNSNILAPPSSYLNGRTKGGKSGKIYADKFETNDNAAGGTSQSAVKTQSAPALMEGKKGF